MQDTQQTAIPAETAQHVLWHFGAGGYQPGTFTKRLFETITAADPANQARMAASYPIEVAAVQMAQNDPDGIARLQRIARGQQ